MRAGIDVFGWLHRGIYTCAMKLCRGIDTTAYVDYCMNRVRMLLHFGVTPVLVFDGADLPMKADTQADRRAKRQEAMSKAEAAFAAGDMRKAEEFYQRACPVTTEMVRSVIRECRKINVEYVVAPYEADAQLAWMVTTNYVDIVITEDSDMLVYGASRIFYKMTKNGDGDYIENKNLASLDTISLNNFTEDMFMYMCVCAGCDFFKGVQGLGIRKAHPIVRRNRTLARILYAIRANARLRVSQTFTADFVRACLVFRHQTVINMHTYETVPLRALDDAAKAAIPSSVIFEREDDTPDLSFLGRMHEQHLVKNIAEGVVCPRTLTEYTEPLDVVPRQPTRAFRPPPSPEVSQPLTVTQPPRQTKGFVVKPAARLSQPPPTQTGSFNAPNLRQRLAASSQITDFDPRRVANLYRRGIPAAGRNPRRAVPSVWERFRPASRVGPSNQTDAAPGENQSLENAGANEGHKETGRTDCVQRKTQNSLTVETTQTQPHVGQDAEDSDFTDKLHLEQEQPEELLSHIVQKTNDCSTPCEHVPGVNPRPDCQSDDEVPVLPLSALRRPAPSASRVNAVKRAMGRFASAPKDTKFKFCEPIKAPRSPDKSAYDLFEQMDAELSRDGGDEDDQGHATSEHPKATVPSAKPKEKDMRRTSPQLRISRFFGTSSRVKKSTDAPTTSKEMTAVRSNSSLPRAGLKRRHSQSVPSPQGKEAHLASIDKFRRGEAGKRVLASDSKKR